MAYINGYQVTSNNACYKRLIRPSCRVKLNGVILAEVYVEGHSNPLNWMRRRPLNETTKSFVAQMRESGIAEETIVAIMQYVPIKDRTK